ncbi:Chromate resistance protein ChrB [Aquihabitans sp. McL0605]|uniref:Chromate resistance protein ChrB n=1 Tax=Aquihabitans sp. McL0605 TaxID=3415671 RepID=UPI003CF0F862
MDHEQEWLVVVARLPADPSRHRVAVWRELRRAGGIPLGGGTWALPEGPTTPAVLEQVRALVSRAEGSLIELTAMPRDDESGRLLEASYTDACEAEWIEFLADCDKYSAEIAREIAKEKFTLAELEEEEQSLDRLRRWHRAVALRDRFTAPSAAAARTRLEACTAELEDFAERVYAALGQL